MPETIEATAPTRIDLAGGTLDIWPLYLFHRGAVTVNTAIDLRASCRVTTGFPGLRIVSEDTGATAEGRDVSELLGGGVLALVARVLEALRIESGLDILTCSRVPAGSGLGGSSALAVTVAAAAAAAVGRPLDPDRLWPVVRDAEAQTIAVPTGVQDYLAAIHGGVLGIHLDPGALRTERLQVDAGRIQASLLLADARVRRFSGINNWDVFKGQIEGTGAVRDCLGRIVAAAAGLREALLAGREDRAAAFIRSEWEARKALAPGVTTPEIDRIVAAAEGAGGAAKVCGAGGGGMVAVWCAPGRRDETGAAVREAGFPLVPFGIALEGVAVRRL